jgi:hypothetical protein
MKPIGKLASLGLFSAAYAASLFADTMNLSTGVATYTITSDTNGDPKNGS